MLLYGCVSFFILARAGGSVVYSRPMMRNVAKEFASVGMSALASIALLSYGK